MRPTPRMPITKKLASACLAVTASVGLAACGSAAKASGSSGSSGALTVVTTVGAKAFVNAPYAYGVSTGIFKKYGIDLHMVWANINAGQTLEELANNSAQVVGAEPTTMMADYVHGIKTECIMSAFESDPTGIITRKSLDITKPADLAGRTIAVGAGSPSLALLQRFLTKEGLSEGSGRDQVHVVQLAATAVPAAMVAGRADGTIGFIPFNVPPLVAKGVAVNSMALSRYGMGQGAFICHVVSDSWAKAHPQTAVALTKALIEATTDLNRDPSLGAKALLSVAGPGAGDAQVLANQWSQSIPYLTSPATKGKGVGWMAPKDMEASMTFAHRNLQLPSSFDDPKAIYTDKYFDQACSALKQMCPVAK